MVARVVLQGVTADTHRAALRDLLALPGCTRAIVSTAFLTRGGVSQVADLLTAVAPVATVIAGIRNGLTSAQGFQAVLDTGCSAYAVDTATRQAIFHPKIYFTRSPNEARLLLGSANLTRGGLAANIEASVSMTLDLSAAGDLALANELEAKIDAMVAAYPVHVFAVPDAAAIAALVAGGRLVDESAVKPPAPPGTSADRDLDPLPKMPLQSPQPAPPAPEPAAPAVVAPVAPAGVTPAAPISEQLELVWESNALTRRDLTIPTNPNSNPTGSMLFKKGAVQNIDQRHYFRDNVFNALPWAFDTAAGRTHIERTTAAFRLVIKDVNYGVFQLGISHNTLTNTSAYLQFNGMTHLHWGAAREFVAKPDLLGRVLLLYRDVQHPDRFVMEID